MSKKLVVSVSHVSKDFQLPHEKVDSLKSVFVNPFRKKRQVEVQHALEDISFDIHEGEFFGIVGRNGSGKSTLLKIIAKIYQPTQGTVTVNGRLVPFIELGVGFNPELTGRENVFLNGALMGFSTQEIEQKYDAIVDFSELERFMDQKLKNYSSGMQVRLAFSVATILAESDVLLIDEVLAVGDADFQRKCFQYFKSLKRLGKTVIFVSHDMSAVREYCDRAVLIDGGKVVKIGETEKIAQAYTKLFSDTSKTDGAADDSLRWGDEQSKTTSISVKTTESTIEIRHKVTASVDIENPIIGMRIRTSAGAEVTGTNTKIEKINVGKIKKGRSVLVTWNIANILSDGDYYIDPAIIDADGITVHDWWDEATKFSIRKDRALPYIVDPGFSVEVK